MTFGFQSAVDIATGVIDNIHTTADSHGRVFIIEVMGHKVGWMTLYAGIAGGADVILIPEIPYDIDKDIVFYEKLVPGSSIVLDEGTFAVLYPADVHRPCGSLDGKLAPVTKVVVKIAVDYIK